MTAEIAILNREAVALAADSAVTMTGSSGEKIFTSANKLFTLSKYHPVGVMLYGSSIFMEIPWETIIKMYRKKLGTRSFRTIREYAEDFINFLCSKQILSKENQRIYFDRTIYSYLNFIRDTIKERAKENLEKKNRLTENDVRQIIKEVIEEQYNLWKGGESSLSVRNETDFHDKIIRKYRKDMLNAMGNVLEKLPFSKSDKNRLMNILTFLFYKFPETIEHSGMSGIVIAGFGEEEIFPSLVAYKMEGILEGTLKYKVEAERSIDFKTGAVIIPFAQKDMVHLFMEGIYEDYLIIERTYLMELFKQFLDIIAEKIKRKPKNRSLEDIVRLLIEDFEEKLSEYRKTEYIDPIMKVVSILPKSELAMMAETLVSLTSLKRKWSTERETVGGPIDVALISKGDGFVWIKRKHYFSPELNPYFFEKYFMEVSGNPTRSR